MGRMEEIIFGIVLQVKKSIKIIITISQFNTQYVTNLFDYGNQEIKNLEFTP